MGKSLYDGDHRYTREAKALGDKTYDALRHIFEEYVEAGYSPREVSHIIQAEVNDLEYSRVLMCPKKEDEAKE